MVKGIFQKFADGDMELLQALKEFTVFRSNIGLELTDEDKGKLLQKLEKFPREQWVSIIRQSIEKGWASFYPIKQELPNFKVSGDPGKWAKSPAFLQAIQDLLNEFGSDGRYHGEEASSRENRLD